MNWQEYEIELHQYFKTAYPDAKVTFDAKIRGRYSKRSRQIDILVEFPSSSKDQTIVVDAKKYARKVDVQAVESFISMLDDVSITNGILITSEGYTESALNRAHFGRPDLDLDIFSLKDLLKYQGLGAIPYSGRKALILPAPMGCVIDAEKGEGYLAAIYLRGLSKKEALKRFELMYLNFWHKDESAQSISALLEFQRRNTLQSYTGLRESSLPAPNRKDLRETRIRLVKADQIPGLELTGFLDCGQFIAFLVCLTDERLQLRNIRKMRQLLQTAYPIEVQFNNHPIIERLKNQVEKANDSEEKSDILFRIAKYFKEMECEAECLDYSRKSFEACPRHFENLCLLLTEELSQGYPKRAQQLSEHIFKLAPTNPTVMIKVSESYFESELKTEFYPLVNNLFLIAGDNHEAAGNVLFHAAQFAIWDGKRPEAMIFFQRAKASFSKVLPNSHEVFLAIQNYENQTA